MKKKQALIKAYTNCNLGDDLFIETLVDRYPSVNFILYAPYLYKDIFASKANLKICNTSNLVVRIINFIFRKIKVSNNIVNIVSLFKSKTNIIIGGSIFIEPSTEVKYIINDDKALNKKQKNFIIGSNFGPFSNNDFLRWHIKYFDKFEDICFRDKYSSHLFEELINTRYANDVIFTYKENIKIKEERSIFISILDFKARPKLQHLQKEYEEKIVEIINCFVEDGYIVKLSSFCKNEGDEEMMSDILKNENLSVNAKKNIILVKYKGNIYEALKQIKSSEYVIATRFHAMILGLLFGKKVFPIIYSDKMKNVILDNEWDMKYIDVINIKDLTVEDLKNNFINSEPIDISKCIESAENQFAILDKYLKQNLEEY
jgi:colanic acid/amylovoran biosynthesis protein